MTINLSHSRPALSAAAFSSGMYCSGRLLALQHGRYAGAQCLIGGSRSTATCDMICSNSSLVQPSTHHCSWQQENQHRHPEDHWKTT